MLIAPLAGTAITGSLSHNIAKTAKEGISQGFTNYANTVGRAEKIIPKSLPTVKNSQTIDEFNGNLQLLGKIIMDT